MGGASDRGGAGGQIPPNQVWSGGYPQHLAPNFSRPLPDAHYLPDPYPAPLAVRVPGSGSDPGVVGLFLVSIVPAPRR